MEFIDRLLGRPTLHSLIRELGRYVRTQGVELVESLPAQMEVVVRRDGSSSRIYLGNLLDEYSKTKRRDRQSVVERFVSSIVTGNSDTPATYADAKPLLLPVVRSAAALGVAMSAGLRTAVDTDFPAIVQRPLVADLAVSLVVDRPNSMAYVNADNLRAWGVTLDQAFDDALHNLRALPEHGGWTEIFPGLWQGRWGDTYESSRILLPDLIYRLGINDPVAMVPFRDVLLVTSQSDARAIQHIVDLAAGSLDSNTRWVSFELLRLNCNSWERYVPVDHQAQLQDLSRRNIADAYAAQKQILDAHFTDRAIDIFVATHLLAQRDGEGLSSYTVWSESVDTLLPEADRVALVRPDNKEFVPLMVPWAMAKEHFGPFFESTDYTPTRFRLRGFPDVQAAEAVRRLTQAG